jgi:Carboxypeptidase regulatory-like domain
MNSFRSDFQVWSGVWIRKAALCLSATLGVLLICLPVFSQGSYGRILGSVMDQTGGAIAGAMVTITDVDRGVSRTLTTDDAGEYNAPNLLPGKYTVRAESKGFKTVERQNVVLEVGKEPRVDLTLQPGEQNQTLTVTEAIPLVEATNATMGGTLNNADIGDLPLNGRDYQNLLALRPGVQLYPGGGPWTQSANGVRPDESVWMVDGVINVNPFDARPIANMPSPFTDAATILPIDAIQEFNEMENPKAEYGWKPGAVVNVGIKSGTNTLHGSAYAFGRTDSWDARNYFNVPPFADGSCALSSVFTAFCNKTAVELKQFGGTAGGKIIKDKLFFFGGYEGLRDSIHSPFFIPVPATASIGDPSKSMVDAITALQTAGVPVSPVSLALTGCTAGAPPTCTGGLLPPTGTSTSFLSAFPNVNQSDNGVGKINYNMNQKNQLTGSLFIGFYNAVGEDRPFTNQLFTDNSPIRTWSNVESWVYTPNSTWVNELRFGYDRVSFNFTNVDINTLADGKGYPINTGITVPGGMPTINVVGFANAGAQMLGTNFNRPQFNSPNPYFDIQDAVSYLRGKHAFKFGFEFAHLEGDIATYSDGRGFFNFNGGATTGLTDCGGASCPLEDFFAGEPSNAIRLVGDPHRTAHWNIPAGFVQDDWRVTPKLIVNLGLRYEYVTPMNMKNNAWATFDPTLGLVQQGTSSRPTLWDGDRNGVEPRLGFAYDVTGKGTTVVRGGASIIHTSWPLFTFLGAFGLQNDNSTSPAAVPTSATLVCNGSGIACPATPGGSNALGTATINGSSLNWNAPAGGPGVFASSSAGISCGDGIGNDPSPCDVMGINKNLRNPFAFNYNLSIQHQIGANLSVELAYVGNHGYRLLNFADVNQSPLGAGWCLNALTTAQLADACAGVAPGGAYNLQAVQEARPFFTKFPYVGFINQVTNRSHSNYNSMQLTVTKRMSQGLSFTAGYTYAHGLDNGSLNRFGLQPQDSNNPQLEYGPSDFDIRHRFTFTSTYNIPGKKGYGQMLEGWQINGIFTYQTPQPWVVFDGGDNISGTGENVDRWDIVGNANDFPSGKNSIPFCSGFGGPSAGCVVTSVYGTSPLAAAQTAGDLSGCITNAPSPATLAAFGCFASANGKSFLVPPPLGQFGNMGRNIFRDSGFHDLDFSIFKNFTFHERFGAQFRWEVFNVLNQPQICNPYSSSSAVNAGNQFQGGGPMGYAGTTPDICAGNPLIGSGSQRVMQLGLKLTF